MVSLSHDGHDVVSVKGCADMNFPCPVSPAQVILRWTIQRGSTPINPTRLFNLFSSSFTNLSLIAFLLLAVAVIPKSSSEARLLQNSDLFGFALNDDDFAGLSHALH